MPARLAFGALSVFGLGLFGGPAGGLGISFRHHLPYQFSYQVTGGIINVDDKLKYDVGFEAQYDLVKGPTGRFFVAGATSYNLYWSTRGIYPDHTAADNVIRNVPGNLVVHSGVTTGVTYCYIVTAMNSTGESADSMQVCEGGVGSIQIVWP